SHGRHVAADRFGNVFVVGGYEGSSIDFGGFTLTNSLPHFDLGTSFLAKYDRWGNFQWAQPAGVYQFSPPPLRAATDSLGNAYFAGRFGGTNSFGTNVLVSSTPGDLFVAKYDPQGQLLW